MPAAIAIPSLIGLGGTVINGLTGHSASTGASNVQSQAANAASQSSLAAGQQAISGVNSAATTATTGVNDATEAAILAAQQGTTAGNNQLQSTLDTQRGNLQPYQQAGQVGLEGLTNLAQDPQDFKFNPEDFNNDPSTAIAIQEANAAIMKSAAARGGLGGGTLKAIAANTVQQAQKGYGDVYRRAEGTFRGNQDARYRALSALTDVGQTAVGQLNAAEGQAGQAQASNLVDLGTRTGQYGQRAAEVNAQTVNNAASQAGRFLMDSTGQSNDALLQDADARASGILGRARSLQGLTSGIANVGIDAAGQYFGNRSSATARQASYERRRPAVTPISSIP